MDLEALDEWTWGPKPVFVHMRRELNEKYRVYMDEEVNQATLLQFIGKAWAVALKKPFTAFYHLGAWLQTPHRSMGRKARERREFFLSENIDTSQSVRSARRLVFQKTYCMNQLPSDMDADDRVYDGRAEHSSTVTQKANVATKESTIRLVTTELLLNTKLYGEFLVLRSDFKWFGPSLPHAIIFAVLKYFGVPDKWLRFFKAFLEVPVVFAENGPNAKLNTRVCDVPTSHVLSDALSEAVLFCLDFAMNKRTGCSNIYRFHDDLWFWGQDKNVSDRLECPAGAFQGYESRAEYGEDGRRTRTHERGRFSGTTTDTPQGSVKWGLLKLDAATGRWVVD